MITISIRISRQYRTAGKEIIVSRLLLKTYACIAFAIDNCRRIKAKPSALFHFYFDSQSSLYSIMARNNETVEHFKHSSIIA